MPAVAIHDKQQGGSRFHLPVDPSRSTFTGTRRPSLDRYRRDKELFMLDVIMLALALGFFAAGIAYAYACERL